MRARPKSLLQTLIIAPLRLYANLICLLPTRNHGRELARMLHYTALQLASGQMNEAIGSSA